MFTVSESVTDKVEIWAIPRSQWADKSEPPFSYRLYAGTSPYQEGAVKVSTQEVTLSVPAGINLLQAALDTLEEAKVRAHEAYITKCMELDQQIQSLRQLSYQPSAEPREVTGEVLTFDDDTPL
jgi:hypothetical protein